MFNWTVYFRREELTVDNIATYDITPENVFLTWGDNIMEAIEDFENTMCISKNQIIQVYATERK